MVFSRWGAFVYRFRRPVAILALVLGLVSLPLAAGASAELSSGGWLDHTSESSRVADRLAADFDAGRSGLIAVFRSGSPGPATSPNYQAAVASSLDDVAADERVSGIVGYAQTGADRFISHDGTATYVVIQLDLTNEESVDAVEPSRGPVRTSLNAVATSCHCPRLRDS